MHFLFVSIPRFLVGKYKITTVVGTMTKINCLSNLPWFWIYLGIINWECHQVPKQNKIGNNKWKQRHPALSKFIMYWWVKCTAYLWRIFPICSYSQANCFSLSFVSCTSLGMGFSKANHVTLLIKSKEKKHKPFHITLTLNRFVIILYNFLFTIPALCLFTYSFMYHKCEGLTNLHGCSFQNKTWSWQQSDHWALCQNSPYKHWILYVHLSWRLLFVAHS